VEGSSALRPERRSTTLAPLGTGTNEETGQVREGGKRVRTGPSKALGTQMSEVVIPTIIVLASAIAIMGAIMGYIP